MDIKKEVSLEQKQTFWAEQLPNFEAKYWLPDHFSFLVFDIEQGNYVVKNDLDPIYEDDANEIYHRVNTGWAMWKKAINFSKSQVSECFVLVPTSKIKYFSNDGENYEVHDTLVGAKHEARCAIQYYEDMLADLHLDPSSDGNFGQIGYGIILAESGYSIDHIVTQDDINNGDYSYEVGTQIMSLHLDEVKIEAQEQSHD